MCFTHASVWFMEEGWQVFLLGELAILLLLFLLGLLFFVLMMILDLLASFSVPDSMVRPLLLFISGKSSFCVNENKNGYDKLQGKLKKMNVMMKQKMILKNKY